MNPFNIKYLSLVAGIIVLFQSCKEQKEAPDPITYTANEIVGTWDLLPEGRDKGAAAMSSADLLANHVAQLQFTDSTGVHEYTGTWGLPEDEEVSGSKLPDYDLMIQYNPTPSHTMRYLGLLREENAHMVFLAAGFSMQKQK